MRLHILALPVCFSALAACATAPKPIASTPAQPDGQASGRHISQQLATLASDLVGKQAKMLSMEVMKVMPGRQVGTTVELEENSCYQFIGAASSELRGVDMYLQDQAGEVKGKDIGPLTQMQFCYCPKRRGTYHLLAWTRKNSDSPSEGSGNPSSEYAKNKDDAKEDGASQQKDKDKDKDKDSVVKVASKDSAAMKKAPPIQSEDATGWVGFAIYDCTGKEGCSEAKPVPEKVASTKFPAKSGRKSSPPSGSASSPKKLLSLNAVPPKSSPSAAPTVPAVKKDPTPSPAVGLCPPQQSCESRPSPPQPPQPDPLPAM